MCISVDTQIIVLYIDKSIDIEFVSVNLLMRTGTYLASYNSLKQNTGAPLHSSQSIVLYSRNYIVTAY